jgi:glucose-1-phosphate adenylyltransferase
VDIPISNSINSGFKKMYVLTQFNSASLHLHLANTYIFDSFTHGFVEILAAEQTFDHSGWYEGTADAVRKNMIHFRTQEPEHYLILSGDQLYRMDLSELYRHHLDSDADVTVACTPVTREAATAFGILTPDSNGWITEFTEKPAMSVGIEHMRIPDALYPSEEVKNAGKQYLGSMGIYFFKAQALEDALDNEYTDFGHEVIPRLIETQRVQAFIFPGFWEDIGTIRSFYETNLNLASPVPDFNFYDEKMPIYTHKRDLPASKFNRCTIEHSLAADGCIINDSRISNSIIGIRSVIESGCELDGVVCMGADYYEAAKRQQEREDAGVPKMGVGEGSRVRGAILDKNTRIGAGCSIGMDDRPREDGDYDNYYIRDGIIIVPKNGAIPPGTVI